MLQLILSLLLQLRPHQPLAERRLIAHEIAAGARTAEDARLLLAVQLHEGAFHTYPFGLTCCGRTPHRPPGGSARLALRILHTGQRLCHTTHSALHYYNTGDCRGRLRGEKYAVRVLRTLSEMSH